MAFYGSGILYGSGSFYIGATTSAAQGIPIDLRFYRTSIDSVYTFWFGFDPAFITPALAAANFDLQLDTVSTFNSPNLITFNSSGLYGFPSPITFQNGNVRKGLTVPVAARINAVVQTWYARVRTHTGSFISAWSATLTWTIPQSVQQSSAEALMESLPDYHVYGKGDLLKPVSQRNTNLWQVENMYGNQLDQVFYANFLTQTDNYVDMCVDENLAENFGVMFNFPKPNSMQYVDYRWILMNLYLASLVGGTNEAVILTVQSFTGVPPIITNIRDLNNFVLTTTQDAPETQTLNTTSIINIIDGTHLEVTSTVDLTHLIVSSTTGMSPGDTIVQGSNTTTIASVIDGTHLVVGNTAGWVTGNALDTTVPVSFTVTRVENGWVPGSALDTTASVPFTVTDVEDSTHLIVSSTAGMFNGDTIEESVFYTSSPFTSELVVEDVTSGPVLNPILLTASTYAVLGDTAVTNTGSTVLNGDLGISPGTSVTGFFVADGGPGVITGSYHNADSAAAQAHTDATTAAATLTAMGPGTDISSTDLHGYTATPGVYSASAAGTWTATGNLTLNGAGTYVFLFGTALTVGANCDVVLTGGATADNVYFITGSTFTFGANDTINGTILAGTSITFASNSVLNGRALTYGPSGTTVTFPSAGLVTVPVSIVPGSGLIVPPSNYTTNGALGYWTMLVPTTNTLQAIFDVGNPIKIFNALQGATALTGLVSFTNGSATVTGGGTSFLSQLSIGDQITDPTGIYLGTVKLITDNTHLTLIDAWVGPTEVVTASRLQYTETQLPIPVLWDSATLAFGVLITIVNPGNFPLY
jgi:hypothetical protein